MSHQLKSSNQCLKNGKWTNKLNQKIDYSDKWILILTDEVEVIYIFYKFN